MGPIILAHQLVDKYVSPLPLAYGPKDYSAHESGYLISRSSNVAPTLFLGGCGLVAALWNGRAGASAPIGA
jgi:hypothetical protein